MRNVLRAALFLTVCSVASPVRADLLTYVKKPEPKFSWKLESKLDAPGGGTIWDLRLTSQVWEGITWTHQLQVYQPADVGPSETLLLWNTGGTASLGNINFGLDLARRIKAPVAFLYDIPNQPLFGDKKEDALIAETFVRYLETKDEDWPLLFPMVKSVVKAMDALQAFALQEWKQPVKSFIVSGASKRGWTTWLTGASDPRVKAIAPVVIDTLNMVEQMDYAKKSFGTYSEMIRDYTARKLVPLPDTADARRLWSMVDPYFYRDRLTMPKMMLNGNNDPYWTVDALNLYWDGLKGDKWVVYIPNAGHNLEQKDAPKGKERERAVANLAAFTRHQILDNPMPKLSWKHGDADGQARLTVTADQEPKGARLWVADSATHDFRKSTWKEVPAKVAQGVVIGAVDLPAEGCRAFYAELDYEIDEIKHQLSTQIRVLEAKK
jgi:PhoPQ-activated pathogenicity-related protein